MLDILNNLTTETKQSYLKTKEDIKNFLYDPKFLLNGVVMFENINKNKKDDIINNNINAIKEMLNDKDNSEEEKENLNKLLNVEFWENYFLDKQDIAIGIGTQLKLLIDDKTKLEKNKTYSNLVNYVIENNTTTQIKNSIIKKYDTLLDIYAEIYDVLMINYLKDIKKYNEETIKNFLFLYRATGLQNIKAEEEKQKIINNLEDKQIGVLLALLDTKKVIYKLLEELEKQQDKQKTKIKNSSKKTKTKKETKLKPKYETIPLFRLDYSDKVAIADNELINILTTKKFNVDLSTIKTSEEILNNLDELDKMILNYIVFEIWGKGEQRFTDRNIAVYLTKDNASATIHETMLKEINESLERLQNTKISEGFISENLSNSSNLKIKRKSALLWLDIVEVDYKRKTTIYRIVDKPFYYDYALDTGKVDAYDREIITRNRKGIEHNLKNTALINYIVERINSLKYLNESFIDLKRVYEILKITDNRKYTDAKNKVYAILEDLKKNYNFRVYKDNTNTRGTTKKIKLTRNGEELLK